MVDRHHRGPDRPPPAGRAGGPRGGPADPVRQQPEADRHRPAQLPRRDRQLPGRLPLPDRPGPGDHLAAPVPLVGPRADGPVPGAGEPVQRPQLRLPAGLPADRSPLAVLAVLPGQRDGDGDPGVDLPLPERRRTAPRDGFGPDELRLLHRRRLERRRRDQARGAFILGPAITLGQVTDGTSSTVAASEQLLGIAGPYSQTTPLPIPSPPSRAFSRRRRPAP